MKPELTPLSGDQEGGQAAHLRIDQHGDAAARRSSRSRTAPSPGCRRRRRPARRGNCRPTSASSPNSSGLSVTALASISSVRAAVADADRAPRPSPAAGSGSCRGPAPCSQSLVRVRGSRFPRAGRAAPRRPRSGRAGRARVDARVERRVGALQRIGRQRAGDKAAANTRSAVNSRSSAIAVETWVPLISASPSLGPSVSGSSAR